MHDIYIYPPACFLARERVLSYFFQIFHFRDFFSETSFQNNFNSTQYREKDSQNNFFYQRITSFKGPHASSIHSLLGSSPPFRHQKTTEKNSVNKNCFFEICVSPGPQKWLPKLTNAHLGASIFRFFSLSAKVWFWTTLQWFSMLLWVSCVTFWCRRCPKSNKTHSCCRGGSGTHFVHAFTENPSKNDSKRGEFFTRVYVILEGVWSIALFLHPFW